MGNDTPISALCEQAQAALHLFQAELRAGDEPADHHPIREELVMSLVSIIGPRPNLFDLEGAGQHQAPRGAPADPDRRRSRKDPPDLGDRRLALHVAGRSTTTRPADLGADGIEDGARRISGAAPKRLCATASTSSSSRTACASAERILAVAAGDCAAGHHHLIRVGLRTSGRPVGRVG